MVDYSNYCSYRVVARTYDRVGYCNYDHAMLRVAWHGNIWGPDGGYIHNENWTPLKKFRGEYGRDRVGILD